MKGVMGLLVAVGLGIVGALCNWLYLAQKAKTLDKVDFIGIADGVQINAGDRFQESHFIKISIPQSAVGNLEKAAYVYSDLDTIKGMTATRAYMPGEILLRQYVVTPPSTEIKLRDNERLIFIPVDTRTFVPSLVNPGRLVSFVVPRLTLAAPPPADGETPQRPQPEGAATETIGPFRVQALGNRLGSPEVMRAAGQNPTQENVMAIIVETKNKAGDLTEPGQKLLELLRLSNFQQVQVLLHPAEGK